LFKKQQLELYRQLKAILENRLGLNKFDNWESILGGIEKEKHTMILAMQEQDNALIISSLKEIIAIASLGIISWRTRHNH